IQQRIRDGCVFVKLAFRFGFGHFFLLHLLSSPLACYDLLHTLFYTLIQHGDSHFLTGEKEIFFVAF
ncbi:MAG TPA: hypothetical protein VFV38_24825, partial [Ktedonobacteraceae bacterium]|nr:hypothetical protein [Ktedonobacteraceae bacterium]